MAATEAKMAARAQPKKPRHASAKRGRARKRKGRYWSGDVTRHSFALDLDQDVFTLDDPRAIAASLKRSAERSARRKGTPFQSAMSMLNFYINRAGRNLPTQRKAILDRAKSALRQAFGRS